MSSYADDSITISAAALPVSGTNLAGDNSPTLDEFTKHARRLRNVYESLQSANLKVGYLESTLKDYHQKAAMLPELESESQRLADLEHEHERLMSRAPRLEEQVNLTESIAKQNEAIRLRLDELHADGSPWWSLIADLIVGQEEGSKSRRRRLSMPDYYHMIQLSIDS